MSSHLRCDNCNESFPSSGRLFFHKTVACPNKGANKSLNLSTDIPIRAESTVPPSLTLRLPEKLPRRPKSTVPPKNNQIVRQCTDYSDLIRIEKDGWSCARPNDKVEVCGKIYPKLSSVKKHTAKCTFSLGTSPFGCDSCSYRAPIIARLVRHLTASAGCPNLRKLSLKTTTNNDSYDKNLVTEKPKSNIEAILDSEQWRCKVCQKAFAKRRGAQTHAFHCQTKSTFSCDNCRFTARLGRLLVKHLLSKKRCQYTSNPLAKKRKLSKIDPIANSEEWLCKICEKRFPSRPSAARHAGSCTGTIVFSCDNCSHTTRFRRAVAKHVHSKTSCLYAKNRLAKKNKKTATTIEHIEESDEWRCKLCEKVLPTKDFAKRHAARCSGESKFHCENCNYSTGDRCNITRHLQSAKSCQLFRRSKHTEKPVAIYRNKESTFICEMCNYSTGDRCIISKHLHSATSCKRFRNKQMEKTVAVFRNKETTFICENCSLKARDRWHIAKHLQSATNCQRFRNKQMEKPTAIPKERDQSIVDQSALLTLENGQWTCVKCRKSLSSRSTAYVHITYSRCTDRIRFVCTRCDYKTNRPEGFKKHNKEGNVMCLAAQKRLWKRENLAKAIVRVGGPAKAQLQCPRCSFTVFSRYALRRHIHSAICHKKKRPQAKTNREEKPKSTSLTIKNGHWACLKCRKEFSSRSKASAHTSFSNCADTRRFACSFCSYKTNRPDSFKLHWKEGNPSCRASKPHLQVLGCEECLFKTKDQSRLNHHRENNGCRHWHQRQELMRELGLSSWPERITEFRCPRCPYVNKSTSQMLSHLQSRIACALMVQTERISALNGARQCENCDKLFASTPALLKHLDSKICRVRGLKMIEM